VQAEAQGEVPQVVDRELHLPALGRALLGQRHDPGVVDQHVQRPVPVGNERRDRRSVGQVEPGDVNVRVAGGGSDVGGDTGSRVGVTVPRWEG
jgi:hypothetical protein